MDHFSAAREGAIMALNAIVEAQTGFANFEDMLNAAGGYSPTLRDQPRSRRKADIEHALKAKFMADAYDAAQMLRGDPRRAYRG